MSSFLNAITTHHASGALHLDVEGYLIDVAFSKCDICLNVWL